MNLRELILQQIDNQDVPRSTSETMILGALDSIGLVNFVMDLEDALAEQGYSIKLVSDKAFSKNSPFATVDTLQTYIEDLIECQKQSLLPDHHPV
jgi:acyl carrier protein